MKTGLDTPGPPHAGDAPCLAPPCPGRAAAAAFALKWSPTGEIIRCELRWSFRDFVGFLEDVGGQDFDTDMGYQYRIGASGESILTDEDDYRTFLGRIGKTRKGTRVSVRPTSMVLRRFLS